MTGDTDILRISTPHLPDDTFVITGLSGHEQISRTYEYTAQLSTGSVQIDQNKLLDQPVTVQLGDPCGLGRYISGIVSHVSQVPYASGSLWRYRLTIVPKLFFLKQTKDCRFFHAQSAPDIIAAIFSDFGIDFENRLQDSYGPHDYTVQFNESYFDFTQRILEDAGIFYFFKHSETGHTLVLADDKTAFTAINNPDIMLQDTGARWLGLSDIHRVDKTGIGQYTVDDYNPAQDPLTSAAVRGQQPVGGGSSGAFQRTHYTWPAVRGTSEHATKKANNRAAASEANAQLYRGSGGSPDFVPGGTFTLNNDPLKIYNYVIHSVSYMAEDNAAQASGGAGSIQMQFLGFPASAEWREPPTVHPPVMAGVYSAKVIGPDGEDIYTDDLGRVQLWFPWDTRGEIKAAQTFWARVIQPWAGPNWGTQFLPRVGMEVAVAFLEGDVNRPVVVGAMYNAKTAPVFAPAEKNKSGIRTRSTLNGDSTQYNELSFDDTSGSELVFLRAQKDSNTTIANNQTLSVGHDRQMKISNDQTLQVGNDHHVTIRNDESITINGQQSVTVQNDQSITIQSGDQSVTLNDGDQSISLKTGSQSVQLDMGDITMQVTQGAISMSAMQSITMRVGDNSVVIDQSGITVNGMLVELMATGSANFSGAMVAISGDGEVSMTAPAIMIG
jgi:type VI secretion system secreted protein VgrG